MLVGQRFNRNSEIAKISEFFDSFTNDTFDLLASIPEFEACAVQVFPAREEDLPNPEVEVKRGRY